MALLVIGYPTLSEKDYNWIQDIRKKQDKLYFNVVNPHFTIVFPTFDIEQEKFILHVRKLLDNTSNIKFKITSSMVVKDSFNDYWHTFLVPDEGNGDLIKLHDKLYTGILQPQLRLDIPFIPHIGIGSSKIEGDMKILVDKLNKEKIGVVGTVNEIEIVSYENDKITTVENIALEN